jgi:hypothetical protein
MPKNKTELSGRGSDRLPAIVEDHGDVERPRTKVRRPHFAEIRWWQTHQPIRFRNGNSYRGRWRDMDLDLEGPQDLSLYLLDAKRERIQVHPINFYVMGIILTMNLPEGNDSLKIELPLGKCAIVPVLKVDSWIDEVGDKLYFSCVVDYDRFQDDVGYTEEEAIEVQGYLEQRRQETRYELEERRKEIEMNRPKLLTQGGSTDGKV